MKSCLSSNLLRYPLLVPVLLVALILVVYYPALFSGIHLIDDPGIIAKYTASPALSSILLPGNSYYYRPLLELSFYLDNKFWGMEPCTMHLENILLHCANSLLVFLLARRIYCDDINPLMPVFATLLFALHPVNVEAVAWIAGRTDPLLTIFILAAFYFSLRWLDRPRKQDMIIALLMLCAALLVKETALAFGAVILLLAMAWPGAATGRQRLMSAVTILVLLLLLVITTLVIRGGGRSGLSRFIIGSDFQVVHAIKDALIALGFYIKKLIIPFPLNFAIAEVHPLNGLLVLIAIPLLWLVFCRFRLSGLLFLSAILLLLPALTLAVKQIAWTPIAERYLYLSTAFTALGLTGIIQSLHKRYPAIILFPLVLVLCGFGFSSFQRNILWGNSLSFFQDTVNKSPEFGSAYYSLGSLLMQQGEIDKAVEAFVNADRLNKRASICYPIKLSIMNTFVVKGRYCDARAYFFDLFKEKNFAPVDFLELLYLSDSKWLESIENDRKIALAQDILETLRLLYQKNQDPFWLYQSGKMALVVGDSSMASEFFHKAYSTAPTNSHYKGAARTYYMRLDAVK